MGLLVSVPDHMEVALKAEQLKVFTDTYGDFKNLTITQVKAVDAIVNNFHQGNHATVRLVASEASSYSWTCRI